MERAEHDGGGERKRRVHLGGGRQGKLGHERSREPSISAARL
jgi:hypothetical protein